MGVKRNPKLINLIILGEHHHLVLQILVDSDLEDGDDMVVGPRLHGHAGLPDMEVAQQK